MNYTRTIVIQAAHFNREETYRLLEQANKCEDEWLFRDAVDLWKQIAADCHGHNFQITIELDGSRSEGESMFLAADEDVYALVMEWNSTNLSLLEDFRKNNARATTEWMAHILVQKLPSVCTDNVEHIKVTVAENNMISASSRLDRALIKSYKEPMR